MSIFDKRVSFKPYDYPLANKFQKAIEFSYWLVSEHNFISDIHDFKVKLNDVERNAIKNALLAISQIEVSVKKFWGNLGDRFPRAEFENAGTIFSSSEVRHAEAYSHLLELLGFNQDFDLILQNPVIQGRVDYLTKYLKGASSNSNENFTLTLTLFSIFIENVSLFSQFVVIKSFNKYLNVLKDVDTVVQSTQVEERIHALFGVYIIEEIKKESPEWFNDEFYAKVYRACKKAYEAECGIIDWIFEAGDLSFLSKDVLKEYIKQRFNDSIEMIGGTKVFEVDPEKVSQLKWFEDELNIEVNVDFFHKRSTSYSSRQTSITSDDLF